MRQKIAIILPLLCLLSYWYIELIAVIISILLTGNIFKLFKGIHIKYLISLLFFILLEMTIILVLDYPIKKCIEQIILITVTAIAYKTYFQHVVKINIPIFIKYYLNINTIMIIYALIAYIFHITISGRLESWGGEPGDISLLTLPSLIYYFYNKEISFRSALAVIGFYLAESTASYAALFLVFILFVILQYRKHILKIALSIIAIFTLTFTVLNNISSEDNNKNNALLKFEETLDILNNEHLNFYELESLNASTYAFITNLIVAKTAPSRFLGTGLGTHPINYEIKYPPKTTNYRLYGLNANDAYSLSIRVFSELGYVGLFALFIFIFKSFNSHSIYSFMALSYIINACITGGHYTANGGMLFFILLYFTGKYSKYKALKFHSIHILNSQKHV